MNDDTLKVTFHFETSYDDADSFQLSDSPDTFLVTTNSSLSEKWPSLMGVYTKTSKIYSGRPVWRNIFSSYQLYYSGKINYLKKNKTLKNNRNFFTMESRCSPI